MNRRIAMTAFAVVVAIALSLGAFVAPDSEADTVVLKQDDVRWEEIGAFKAVIISGEVFRPSKSEGEIFRQWRRSQE